MTALDGGPEAAGQQPGGERLDIASLRIALAAGLESVEPDARDVIARAMAEPEGRRVAAIRRAIETAVRTPEEASDG